MTIPSASIPARPFLVDAAGTRMYAEAAEASTAVARQLASNASSMAELATRLRSLGPRVIFTCARGSSDHAATYAKYLFETRLGIPTLSHAPSVSSIYGSALGHMQGQPFILVSQSGRSPDLLASAEAATKAGALVIALVNDTNSPLAAKANIVIPLHAGPETSVAATKSYIAMLAAFAGLTGLWARDGAMNAALAELPEALSKAWEADWSAGIEPLAPVGNLYVLGRGLTLGIAQEAALKCKETSGIHGEAFSSAEIAHGPMALVGPDHPVLVFPPLDPAAAGLDALVTTLLARGVTTIVAGEGPRGVTGLPVAKHLHPVTGPIVMIQSFYRMVNALAVRRGYDPDHPAMLRKVTETL